MKYSVFTLLEHCLGGLSGLKIPGPVKGRTGSIPVSANKKPSLQRMLALKAFSFNCWLLYLAFRTRAIAAIVVVRT